MSVSLTSLSKAELETLAKELRAFRSAEKKIGKRARALFSGANSGVRVELAPGADEGSVSKTLKQLGLEGKDISFAKNERLSGGARIFVGDDLYDLTFENATAKI
jgi:hypothetical protein